MDQKLEAYDEDVGGAETQESVKEDKVGNDESQLRVSDHYTVILILYLKCYEQNSLMLCGSCPRMISAVQLRAQ